jgi:FAD/FMN-containing dehydrogenase
VGSLKVHTLPDYKDPVAMALMRRFKDALDPGNLMNPGRLLSCDHKNTDRSYHLTS